MCAAVAGGPGLAGRGRRCPDRGRHRAACLVDCHPIRAEERQLTQALGAEYEHFAAGRKRLVPGVW